MTNKTLIKTWMDKFDENLADATVAKRKDVNAWLIPQQDIKEIKNFIKQYTLALLDELDIASAEDFDNERFWNATNDPVQAYELGRYDGILISASTLNKMINRIRKELE